MKTLSAITILVFLIGCNEPVKQLAPKKIDLKYVNVERYPLPYPPEIVNTKDTSIDSLYKDRELIEANISALSRESITLSNKQDKISELRRNLALNTGKIAKLKIESICGNNDDSQPVELYDGTLGVSKAFVEKISKSVGQLQWKYDFGTEFLEPDDREGNVKGVRWCTGTLVGKNIFITAGHCFDRDEMSGWQFPKKGGKIITGEEMIKLMKVNFNYEVDRTTGKLRSDTIDYPVETLKEYRNGNLDYAIILLGKDSEGKYPGEKFGFVGVSKIKPVKNEMVAIIQHPLGNPKVIEAGRLFSVTSDLIGYDDIDTQAGASGSAVISASSNKIVGIHVLGGCDDVADGSNHATPVFLILQASPTLKAIAQ